MSASRLVCHGDLFFPLFLHFRMVRPSYLGRRGPIPKDVSNVSKKTLRNRRWKVGVAMRRFETQSAVLQNPSQVGCNPKKVRKSRALAPSERVKAPVATTEMVLEVVQARHSSFDTWKHFAKAKANQGVYKNKAIKLEQKLLTNLQITDLKAERGAFVHPTQAIPTFLALIERDEIIHPGAFPRALNLFLDANNMKQYKDMKCQLLAFSVPYGRQPHQLGLILTIARWLGDDCPWSFSRVFKEIGLVSALQKYLGKGLNGYPIRLTFTPDWGNLKNLFRWFPPGHENACPECWAKRSSWKQAGYPKQPLRRLKDFDTPLGDFLNLFENIADIVYDPLHCVNLVVSHAIIHGLYWWAKQQVC